MADKPLAVYTDVTVYRKQRVEVYNKKVHCRGNVLLKGDYESDVSLDTLSGDYQVFNYRNSAFWYFFIIWVLAVAVAVLYCIIGWTRLSPIGMLTLISLVVALGSLSAVTFPKTRMVQFLSAGGQPMFLMCKCGKDKDRFEQVVSLIAELIGDVRDKDETASTSAVR